MNYFGQMRAFYDRQILRGLSCGQIALWHAVMDIANRLGWPDWFEVREGVLCQRGGLSRSGLVKARERLVEEGFLLYRQEDGRPMYSLPPLGPGAWQVVPESLDGGQDSGQIGVQDGVHSGVQNPVSPYRQRQDKKRQDETEKKHPHAPCGVAVDDVGAVAACPGSGTTSSTCGVAVDGVEAEVPRLPKGTKKAAPKTKGAQRAPSREKEDGEALVRDVAARLAEVSGRRCGPGDCRTLVLDRAAEGYALMDFYRVMALKAGEWRGDPKMDRYLRPETLFGAKFSRYLAEARPEEGKGGREGPPGKKRFGGVKRL